jgi:hypothetical protein
MTQLRFGAQKDLIEQRVRLCSAPVARGSDLSYVKPTAPRRLGRTL